MLKRIIKKLLRIARVKNDTYSFDALGSFYKKEDMVFLGSQYGGWYIPEDIKIDKDDVCYFVGAGEDITFDCSIAAFYPCKVHIFDPTPKSIIHFNALESQIIKGEPISSWKNMNEYNSISGSVFEKISFYPWGVAGEDGEQKFFLPSNPDHVSCSIVNLQKTEKYFTAECFTLKSIMHKLGHYNLKILKIDIEGAEYQVIDNMITTEKFPYLLAIEFDELHTEMDKMALSRVDEYVRKIISSGYNYIFRDSCNLVFIRK